MLRGTVCSLLLAAALCAGCAAKTGKPVFDAKAENAAKPQLEAYLTRVVGGADQAVRLLEAEQFLEGHSHETWRLLAQVGTAEVGYSLKVFPDEATAKRVAEAYRQAEELGWPVPKGIAAGALTPYKPSQGSLREYVGGESLALKVRTKVQTGTSAAAIAALYGKVARKLGELHAKGRRPRQDSDEKVADTLKAFGTRCSTEGWCSAETAKACEELAAEIDPPEVTFLHGDLYESQIIFDPADGLAAIIDLDQARWGDPAADLGALLAHVMLVNPMAREARWGVENPREGEVRATAEAILTAYREGSGAGDGWSALLKRTRAHMRLRVAHLIDSLKDNPHGKRLVEVLLDRRRDLADSDPFTRYGLTAP